MVDNYKIVPNRAERRKKTTDYGKSYRLERIGLNDKPRKEQNQNMNNFVKQHCKKRGKLK